MTFASWLASVLGRAVDVDGAYGAQCVDLVNDYLARVRGAMRVRGNAIDIAAQPIAAASWVPNGPFNHPSVGDVIVWSNPPNGHTAIALAADSSVIISLDQNWAYIQRAMVVSHNYASVVGWHHFSKEIGP